MQGEEMVHTSKFDLQSATVTLTLNPWSWVLRATDCLVKENK